MCECVKRESGLAIKMFTAAIVNILCMFIRSFNWVWSAEPLGAELLQGNTRLAATPRPILVLDWEANTPSFAERLYAVLKGAGLPVEPCVAYKHPNKPFIDVVDQIAKAKDPDKEKQEAKKA